MDAVLVHSTESTAVAAGAAEDGAASSEVGQDGLATDGAGGADHVTSAGIGEQR